MKDTLALPEHAHTDEQVATLHSEQGGLKALILPCQCLNDIVAKLWAWKEAAIKVPIVHLGEPGGLAK